nr:T-cell receptor V beta CDR3 region {clone V8Mz11} [mice, NOD, spleen, Peptide Partial, 17 aa] [Mus sp.]
CASGARDWGGNYAEQFF